MENCIDSQAPDHANSGTVCKRRILSDAQLLVTTAVLYLQDWLLHDHSFGAYPSM